MAIVVPIIPTMTTSMISMRILQVATFIMSCLPICLGISLISYYHWVHHFLATRQPQETSRLSGFLRQLTEWSFSGAVYTLLPNLICMLVLFGHSRVEKKPITMNLVTYGLGIAMFVYLLFIDGWQYLGWYWD